MTRTDVSRNGLRLLALLLVAAAAQAAPGKVKAHGIVRGEPLQIPIMDGDMGPQDVSSQAALLQIAAPLAQTYSRGAGVTVAVLDGGFDLRHEALAGKLHPMGWDVIDGDADPQDLGNGIDDDLDMRTDALVGHGTFVSSIVLAVAPDARILPIRVLDDEGWGTEQGVALGVQHAMAQGARVINLSLVVPDASHVLRDMLRNAADAGIVVVGAGGNDPDEWHNDPSLSGRILAVGGVDAEDRLLPWSATGSQVDAYAPGAMIKGALGGAVPDSYGWWSGTSFSAPFVSGGAALLVSQNPAILPQDVVTRLTSTVDPALDVWPTNRGRIDLGAALAD